MTVGLLVLIGFQIAGELLVFWLQLPVPGAVVGMLLLLASLRLAQPLWPEPTLARVGETSRVLINHLSLLFLPAGVGIFFLPDRINAQWPAVLAAMVAGTFVSMLLCSWLWRLFSARSTS